MWLLLLLVEELPMMSKEEVADALLDRIMKARQ